MISSDGTYIKHRGTGTMGSELLHSPDLFPLHIDLVRGLVHFVPMSRDGYRASVFLDQREIQSSTRHVFLLGVADLGAAIERLNNVTHPTHFILHAAFSCSTLLTRYLDLFPEYLVLREPQILTELAAAPDRCKVGKDSAQELATWNRALHISLRLLARTYEDQTAVIIKTSDRCNSIGSSLLMADTRSRIVFLTVPLRVFLLSILKSVERRQWLRQRLPSIRADVATPRDLAEVNPVSLSDAQAGAYLWVWSENLRLLLCEGFPSRVLSIDSEDVAQKPEIAAQRSMEHFGLPVRSSLIGRGITSAAVEGRHAKNASRKFNSVTRKRDLRELETRHHREVQTGLEMGRKLLTMLKLPETLV